MTEVKTVKSYKGAIVVTYILALLFLLAGFFLPLYGGENKAMLFQYLPDALNKAIGINLIKGKWVTAHPFTEVWGGYMWGDKIFGFKINIYAWMLLLYTVVTVVGIFMIFPVLLGSKTKRTSEACAYTIEIMALLFLTIYYLFYLNTGLYSYAVNVAAKAKVVWYNYSILIAYAGVLVILILQSFITKQGLGVIKFILFLLSALVVLCLFNFGQYFKSINKSLSDIAKNLKSYDGFTNYTQTVGSEARYWDAGIIAFYLLLAPKSIKLSAMKLYPQIFTICLLAAVVLAILNLFIDMFGLATINRKRSNGKFYPKKSSKVFGLIRYLLAFLLFGAVIIMLAIFKTKPIIGIYLWAILIITFIQLIIAIIRVARIKRLEAKYREEEGLHFDDEVMTTQYEENVEIVNDEEPQKVSRAERKRAEKEAREQTKQEVVEETPQQSTVIPAPTPIVITRVNPDENSQATAQPQQTVTYAQPVQAAAVQQPAQTTQSTYNGPIDAFIASLDDPQKNEFADLFIYKNKGNYNKIPDYVVGGDNTQFFRMIFVYLNKFRTTLSPQLFDAMYRQLGNN